MFFCEKNSGKFFPNFTGVLAVNSAAVNSVPCTLVSSAGSTENDDASGSGLFPIVARESELKTISLTFAGLGILC